MTFPLLSTIYTPHLPPICRASACCFTSSALSPVTQAMVSSLQLKDVSTSACRAMEKPWETPWKTDIFHRKTMENPWKTNKILKSPQFTLELRTHSIFLRQLWIAMNTRQWSVPRICGKWFAGFSGAIFCSYQWRLWWQCGQERPPFPPGNIFSVNAHRLGTSKTI